MPHAGRHTPKPYWDRGWLVREYVIYQRSARDIADEFGCIENNILYFLHKHGIETRTVAQARAIKYWGSFGPENGMYGRCGEDNPNWRGGISPERQAFYSSPEWKRAAAAVWKRDNAMCARCGVHRCDTPDEFHIHHIESFANEALRCNLANLVLLCKTCHNFVHSNDNEEREFIVKGGD